MTYNAPSRSTVAPEPANPEFTVITVLERVGSVLSILGCLFIIVTFATSKTFHRPINRLVFYASFGNIMTNVGSLMAREYIYEPNSAGCQLQGFLIQMFLPADALWTLAMAVNVYLTFYYKYDAVKLKKMEVWYFLFCYGIPFIPALTFAFVSDPDYGRIYGDASLWCWVSSPWDAFRIATFYGPIWLVILVTFFIYIRAGRDIYHNRQQLRNVHGSSTFDFELQPWDDPVKTTEFSVTTEAAGDGSRDISRPQNTLVNHTFRLFGGQIPNQPTPDAAYSVTISCNKQQLPQMPPNLQPKTITIDENLPRPKSPPEVQPAQSKIQELQQRPTTRGALRRWHIYEGNKAMWQYTKCAILFFTALLITWIPSSANRVFGVVHPGLSSEPLEIMSALVLPLQGFWNAAIYMVTSWQACKLYYSDVVVYSMSRLRGGINGSTEVKEKSGVNRGRGGSRAGDINVREIRKSGLGGGRGDHISSSRRGSVPAFIRKSLRLTGKREKGGFDGSQSGDDEKLHSGNNDTDADSITELANSVHPSFSHMKGVKA